MGTGEDVLLGRGEDVESVMAASRVIVALTARSLTCSEDVAPLPRLRVLMMVASRRSVRLAEIAVALGVHASSANRMVERLAADGLLDRHDDPDDARQVRLRLTPTGRELVQRLVDERRCAVLSVLHRMPGAPREALAPLLRAFTRAAGELPEVAVWSLGWPSA